ncbi:mitochondrial matrix Mmp37 [Gonapodya prolifera JEL478]|uniref:Phosphatidate cytidylyltransferase, mitochondrial n=1 Tax=Gonapodya prolifera (strain JEL478) TaxID=1344416 RepID=A0A139AY98_GONPJ|nr:mitochondrial matrix Mmp37 [Gonapodya prolifera JEL478]|eukprot:KXS21722.1 mitochondrial matrix Mmp37 [Gonapodya prolifera JEL478]
MHLHAFGNSRMLRKSDILSRRISFCCPFPKLGQRHSSNTTHPLEHTLKSITKSFDAPITYAIGYGSGVFQQEGYDKATAPQPMLDFLFAVDDPVRWHCHNINQNPHHYTSFTRSLLNLHPSLSNPLLNRLGAGVWFNSYVEINGFQCKYGVMGVETLWQDLKHWRTFYFAGRLQKPTNLIVDAMSSPLADHNETNLLNALRVALLLLPPVFTSTELWMAITGLSYMGDFRTFVGGENPNKVRNIVSKQEQLFESLYNPLLKKKFEALGSVTDLGIDGNGQRRWEQIGEPGDRVRQFLLPLPEPFRSQIFSALARRDPNVHAPSNRWMMGLSAGWNELDPKDLEHLGRRTVTSDKLGDCVKEALVRTMFWPALTQSAKGLLTVGISSSVRYALEKLKKGRS